MRNVFHVFSFLAMMAVSHSSYSAVVGSQHQVELSLVQISPWFSSNDLNTKSSVTNITRFNIKQVILENEDFIDSSKLNKEGGASSVNNIVKKESVYKY